MLPANSGQGGGRSRAPPLTALAGSRLSTGSRPLVGEVDCRSAEVTEKAGKGRELAAAVGRGLERAAAVVGAWAAQI